ncbi:hypothetical protein B0T22DRAFT_128234 [Podospora appendiculata]|uniref:Uncharacterized protein n=1 Tax=Podospora appendiculata TaxID=314037 RepID=A0AAE0X7S4_9PEZI|nr:hypothetical protein B0T22DRAFT_128234 [Podospora appendiculata]
MELHHISTAPWHSPPSAPASRSISLAFQATTANSDADLIHTPAQPKETPANKKKRTRKNHTMDLPQLTSTPARHSASCASLSLPLLSLLHAVLPQPPSLTLSIGAGPGLLEALLLKHHPSRACANPASLYGIEVAAAPPVNRFLPEANAVVVGGTWAVAREVADAEALVFVYPRQVGLVRTYLDSGARVRVVVWIGPRCDVSEFLGPLGAWGVEDVALMDWEGGKVVENGEVVLVFHRREGGVLR